MGEELSVAEKRGRIFSGDDELRQDLVPKARRLLIEIERVAKEIGVDPDLLLDSFREVLMNEEG